MAVKFKTTPRKNPQDQSLPAKYYATVSSSGVIDLKELSQLLSDGSTTRESDVYAVLIGLVNAIKKQLSNGLTVKLGDLGEFKIGVNSTGAETAKEVTANNIINRKIRYRTSKDLKKMLNNIDFEKESE